VSIIWLIKLCLYYLIKVGNNMWILFIVGSVHVNFLNCGDILMSFVLFIWRKFGKVLLYPLNFMVGIPSNINRQRRHMHLWKFSFSTLKMGSTDIDSWTITDTKAFIELESYFSQVNSWNYKYFLSDNYSLSFCFYIIK